MVKIEALEQKIAGLETQVQDAAALQAQVKAKDMALQSRLGNEVTDLQSLPPQAWGLLWQVYFERKKEWQFVSPDGKRSKNDKFGNKWSLHRIPSDLAGFEDIADALSVNNSDDVIVLHCVPNTGAYDIACVDIDKHVAAHREAQKQIHVLKEAIANCRGNQEKIGRLQLDLDHQEEVARKSAIGFQQCKAVIENAIERFYAIPIASFESMDLYGMDIHCRTATIKLQKKHQVLPNYTPAEQLVPSGNGEDY